MSDTIALSSVEAARELRFSVHTLMRWTASGKIPHVCLGGRKYLYSRKAISALVEGSNTQPPATGAVVN
jgi:excisionase family DNA binding protein